MAIKDDDLDDDLDLPEDEDGEEDESESDSGESSEGADNAGEDDSGSDENESDDSVANKEKEVIRERRRREKRMKREKDRRERFELQNAVVNLQKTVKRQDEELSRFKGSMSENETRNLTNEMGELVSIYNDAQAKMEAAITANDGSAFRKAKEIADRAWARHNTLELAKRQRSNATETKDAHTGTESRQTDDSQRTAGIKLGDKAVQYGRQFMKENESWYKVGANGQAANLDSMIVVQLDKELYDEGYDPESKEYWIELKDRVRERIPHRFKNQSNGANKKPKVITGGGGRDSNNGGANIEKTLPVEFVRNLKAAGYWEDPKKKKAAIDDYMKNRKAKG